MDDTPYWPEEAEMPEGTPWGHLGFKSHHRAVPGRIHYTDDPDLIGSLYWKYRK